MRLRTAVQIQQGLKLHQIAKTYLASAEIRDSVSSWMRQTYDRCNPQ